MGNPHPLEMQQLVQPPATHLAPIVTQHPPASTNSRANLAFRRPSSPPFTSSHPKHSATNPAPTMVPMMPQLHPAPAQATMPRDPTEYTQANFPSLTPRQLAVLAQLEMQNQRTHSFATKPPSRDRWTCAEHRLGPYTATNTLRPLEATQDAQIRLRSEPPTAPRGEMQTRRPSPRGRSRSRTRHPHHAIADPEAATRTKDPAATERSRSQLGKLPAPDSSLTGERLSKWSYRAPPTRHNTHKRDTANLRSLRWRRERHRPTRSCTPATTAPIAVPTIQLHGGPQQHHQPTTTTGDGQASSGATPRRTTNTRIVQRNRCCPALPHPFRNGFRWRLSCSAAAGATKRLTSVPK